MNSPGLLSRIRHAYSLLVRVASWFQSPLLLVLRLYWGWAFFQAGSGKLDDLSTPTKFFTDLGIPFPEFNAVLVGCTECFGGLLLMAGLASRLTTIPMIITMIVAYLTAEHEAAAAFFSDQDKFIESAPLTYLMVLLVVFAFGPGRLSLDYLLGKKFASAASETTPSSQSA